MFLLKKEVVVAGIDNCLRGEYYNQIRNMMGNSIELKKFAIGKENKPLKVDLVISLTHAATPIVKQFSKNNPLLVLKTMFTKEALRKIRDIPEGENVLLISYEWTYVLECIELLHKLGINHINLIPYYKSIDGTYFKGVNKAIYMGEKYMEPSFIDEFIDIGWRVITPECYEEILNILNIENEKIESKLVSLKSKIPYENSLVDITMVMSDLGVKSRMQRVFDALPIGILIIDDNDVIEIYNNYLCNIFNISNTELIGKNIRSNREIGELYDLLNGSDLSSTSSYSNRSVNKEFIVKKKSISFMNKIYQKVITLEEFVYDENHNRKKKNNSLYSQYSFNHIVGVSHKSSVTVDYAKKYAQTDVTILILGETGTGKELYAHAIHNYSSRRDNPFISINCAAIPDELLESELFGYEKGSFTGANTEGKKGLLEVANGGTVFLDEIGDASTLFQVKLLRAIQEKEIVKIGGYKRIPLDIRIIAATNRKLEELKDRKNFRKDLFYRLSGCVLMIPPLRERKSDIPILAKYFLGNMGAGNKVLDIELEKFLMGYEWDGNVRELKNCVEYLGYFGQDILKVEDLPMMYKEIYIENKEEDLPFDKLNDFSNSIAKDVMELLQHNHQGRRQLLIELRKLGIETSEYEVRSILDYLESQGLIEKFRGRKGAALTEKGEKWVSERQ